VFTGKVPFRLAVPLPGQVFSVLFAASPDGHPLSRTVTFPSPILKFSLWGARIPLFSVYRFMLFFFRNNFPHSFCWSSEQYGLRPCLFPSSSALPHPTPFPRHRGFCFFHTGFILPDRLLDFASTFLPPNPDVPLTGRNRDFPVPQLALRFYQTGLSCPLLRPYPPLLHPAHPRFRRPSIVLAPTPSRLRPVWVLLFFAPVTTGSPPPCAHVF